MSNQQLINDKLINTLPADVVTRLSLAGVDIGLIQQAKIQVNTNLSKLITKIFGSAATTFGYTIYADGSSISFYSIYGLGLIAHELIHIDQWKQEGLFYLIKYIGEFLKYGLISIIKRIKRENLPPHWVHDQISYEKQAIAHEENVQKALRRALNG